MDPSHVAAWTGDLNDEQGAFVLADNLRVVAAAGAGSGKTRSFSRRVAHLLSQGVSPARILAVTFTRKAAGEMLERIIADCRERGVPTSGGLPTVSTIHSWGLKVVRRHAAGVGRTPNVSVYDERDREDILRAITEELGPKETKIKNPWTCRLSTITKREVVMREYEERLREGDALDFDAIESSVLELLTNWPAAQAEWSGLYDEVLVDEYQDTNIAQTVILGRLLPRRFYVVGDARQSIYGFRGAEVKTIREHAADAGFRTIALDTNYRSVPGVVEAANRIMGDFAPMKAARPPLNDMCAPVDVRQVPFEPAAVVAAVEELVGDGYDPSDIMVLGRAWSEVGAAFDALVGADVPAVYCGKKTDPWTTDEGRAILRICTLASNRNDNNVAGLLARWGRYGRDPIDIGAARADAATARVSLLEHLANIDRVFAKVLELWRHSTPDTLACDYVETFLEALGWFAECKDRGLRSRLEQMRELLASVEVQTMTALELCDWHLAGTTGPAEAPDGAEGVQCMTVHASKGLEARAVILLHLIEGRFPATGSKTTPEEQAEDKRILYVAVTRARDRFIGLAPTTRSVFGRIETVHPSRWAPDIAPVRRCRPSWGTAAPAPLALAQEG